MNMDYEKVLQILERIPTENYEVTLPNGKVLSAATKEGADFFIDSFPGAKLTHEPVNK